MMCRRKRSFVEEKEMSRLVFREEVHSDSEIHYQTEEDEDDQENGQVQDLIALDDDVENQTTIDLVEDSDDYQDDDEDNDRDKDNDMEEEENRKSKSITEINMSEYSSFLAKFLATKKSSEILPPPVVTPLNDYILKEFAMSEKERNRKIAGRGNHVNIDEDKDNDKDDGIRVEDEKEESKSVRSESDDDSVQFIEQFPAIQNSEATTSSLTLTLFNLPYNMTADEIESICLRYGVPGVKAEVMYDKKMNRPAGCAQVIVSLPNAASPDFDLGASTQSITKALDGKDFRGRPIRVRTSEPKNRPSFGGAGAVRYFGGDISIKCNNCGKVGHRQTECPQEIALPPCHFCAGTDHEPQDCLNIACFRCSNFGHHSKNCPNPRSSKPVICTLCGSFTHDKRHCHLPSIDAREKLETPRDSIICMCCGKYGHVRCLALPMPKNRSVYCPECGLAGHNAEYVRDSKNEPSCQNPNIQRYRRRVDERSYSTSERNSGRKRSHHQQQFPDNDNKYNHDKEDEEEPPPIQKHFSQIRSKTFPSHSNPKPNVREPPRHQKPTSGSGELNTGRVVTHAGAVFSRGGGVAGASAGSRHGNKGDEGSGGGGSGGGSGSGKRRKNKGGGRGILIRY